MGLSNTLEFHHITAHCVPQVSAQAQTMDSQFARMQRTVQLVTQYDQTLPESTQRLFDSAPARWNNLRTKVSLAKQRLGPRIQEESEGIAKVGTGRGSE